MKSGNKKNETKTIKKIKKLFIRTIITAGLLLAAGRLCAEEIQPPENLSGETMTLPEYRAQAENLAANHAEIMNHLEEINFLDTSTLSLYDTNGNFCGLTISDSEGNTVTFALGTYIKTRDGNDIYRIYINGEEIDFEMSRKEGDTSPPPARPIIVIYTPAGQPNRPRAIGMLGDTEDGEIFGRIAEDPKEAAKLINDIKTTINDVKAQEEEAREEYTNMAKKYYNKSYKAINSHMRALQAEGIDVSQIMILQDKEDIGEEKKRDCVDKAIAYIEQKAAIMDTPIPDTNAFLDIIKGYRAEFLFSAKLIYEQKIKSITEYLNAVIEKVLQSRLAFYLDSKEEKIEVLINLPKLDIKKKSE